MIRLQLLLVLLFTTIILSYPSRALAQACDLNTTGDIYIVSNCILSGVIGIDDGTSSQSTSVNRASFKVAPNIQVTISNGTSLSVGILDLTGGGTIVYPATFNIDVGKPVWVLDHDHDGFAADLNSVVVSNSSPGADYVRKNAIVLNGNDLNDNLSCPANTCVVGNTCQRCQNGGAINVAAGNACQNGIEVAVTTTAFCGTTATTIANSSSANTCSGLRTNTTYYRACNGAGSCYADNTSAASIGTSSTIYAANGKVYTDSIGTTSAPSSTYKCNTADVTVASSCSGTRNYRACNGIGSCRLDNTYAATSTIYAVDGKIYTGSTGITATPNAAYYCGTALATTASSCQGTIYYRACNGSGSCRGDNTGAGTGTYNAANGYVFVGLAGETSTPSSTYNCFVANTTSAGSCSGTRYYRACGGSGGCRVDNVGAASDPLNAANGKVFTNSVGTTANPSSSYNCAIVNSCTSGYCYGTNYYSACDGSGSCRNDTIGAGVGTTFLAANGTYYNAIACGTTAVGACSGGNNCNTFWQDSDGDSVGKSSSTALSCGSVPPAGYATGSGTSDCCDTNASIYPGNANYYTSAHAACTGVASNWDYDCSGTVQTTLDAYSGITLNNRWYWQADNSAACVYERLVQCTTNRANYCGQYVWYCDGAGSWPTCSNQSFGRTMYFKPGGGSCSAPTGYSSCGAVGGPCCSYGGSAATMGCR
jgi:hypothetical protein